MLAIASSTVANPNGRASSIAGDEVRDHVARAEHLRRVEDPPVPLDSPDVALLAGADDREEARVPDLVVRVVDRDPVVLVALDVLARERLRDHLADPAARGSAPRSPARSGRRSRPRRGRRRSLVTDPPVSVYACDAPSSCSSMIASASSTSSTGLIPGVRPAGPLVLAPVVVDVAEAALLLGAEVLAEPEHGEVDQVAPLDRRRGLHHRLAVRERVPVVRPASAAARRRRPRRPSSVSRAADDAVRATPGSRAPRRSSAAAPTARP